MVSGALREREPDGELWTVTPTVELDEGLGIDFTFRCTKPLVGFVQMEQLKAASRTPFAQTGLIPPWERCSPSTEDQAVLCQTSGMRRSSRQQIVRPWSRGTTVTMPNRIRHRLAGISFQAPTACPKSAALPPSLLLDSP